MGGIENANGSLRRWLPRQTNIDDLSDEDLQEIAMTYNLTPLLIVEAARPIAAATARIECPAARSTAISSLSSRVRWR